MNLLECITCTSVWITRYMVTQYYAVAYNAVHYRRIQSKYPMNAVQYDFYCQVTSLQLLLGGWTRALNSLTYDSCAAMRCN